MRLFILKVSFILFCFLAGAHAKTIEVTSAEELRSASKKAKPGDHLLIADGSWKSKKIKLTLKGTRDAPITISPANPQKFNLRGESSIEIIGEHIILDSLVFKDGSLKDGHVLKIRGEHCRVTRCSIQDYNPSSPKTRYHWLSLYGHHHRVDRCSFSGQNHSGVTLVVWLKGDEVGHHRIERNYFGNRPRGNDNGFETLRIGTSENSMKLANCVVIQNLFESCDGEIEMVSIKSGGNTILGNTLEQCAGGLTLRHGNNSIVQQNLIFAGGKKATGGIRIVGTGHQVIRNFVEGTTGRTEAAISLSAGVPNPKLNEHDQVRDLLISENQLFKNKGGAFCLNHGIGSHGRKLLPKNITFRGNIFDEVGDNQLGEWQDNLKTTKRNLPLPAHRLTRLDVGPNLPLKLHPEAAGNTHAVGKVDVLGNVPFIVPNPKSLSGIVIDETEAELVGKWQYSTHTPPYVGAGYLHDQKNGKGAKSVTYQFHPPISGTYHVEVSHCFNVRRATNTPITIRHEEGETTVRINQQEKPEYSRLFRSLGTFRFEKGKENWVRISNEGTEGKVVIADSVRFSQQ